jgi:uncharacterized protein (DUF2384 family)
MTPQTIAIPISILEEAKAVFGCEAKAKEWFETPEPWLDNKTPLQMLAKGSKAGVLDALFIRQCQLS